VPCEAAVRSITGMAATRHGAAYRTEVTGAQNLTLKSSP
jgi:hypothetical protein